MNKHLKNIFIADEESMPAEEISTAVETLQKEDTHAETHLKGVRACLKESGA